MIRLFYYLDNAVDIESFERYVRSAVLVLERKLTSLGLKNKLCGLCDAAYEATGELETALAEAKKIADTQTKAEFFRDRVIPTMNILRERIDSAEKLTATDSWPFPSYGDIMFKI